MTFQLINSTLEWERRLEYEEERRKHHRAEPYVNYLAAPQPACQDSKIKAGKRVSDQSQSMGIAVVISLFSRKTCSGC